MIENNTIDDILAILEKVSVELWKKYADTIKIEEVKFNTSFIVKQGNKDFTINKFYPSTGESIKITGKKQKM